LMKSWAADWPMPTLAPVIIADFITLPLLQLAQCIWG
jgi:hypothetical protein